MGINSRMLWLTQANTKQQSSNLLSALFEHLCGDSFSQSSGGFFLGEGGVSVHILGIEGCVYDHHHDRDSTKIRGKIEI